MKRPEYYTEIVRRHIIDWDFEGCYDIQNVLQEFACELDRLNEEVDRLTVELEQIKGIDK